MPRVRRLKLDRPLRQSIHFRSVMTHEGKVLVLYEDGKPEIEKGALAIAERLQEQGREACVKGASEVGISDILAAGMYVLGADAARSSSFAELERVFKGVNLAGRRAAFFGSSGAAVAWLRSLCADTEAATAHSDFVGRPDAAALSAWLKAVLAGA